MHPLDRHQAIRVPSAALLFAVFLICLPACRAEGEAAMPGRPRGMVEIQDLNHAFRQAYAAARDEIILGGKPLLIVSGDELVLFNGSQRSAWKYQDEQFTVLKTIAHAPLSVFVALEGQTDETLSPETLERLGRLEQLMIEADLAVDRLSLPDDASQRQHVILKESIDLQARWPLKNT